MNIQCVFYLLLLGELASCINTSLLAYCKKKTMFRTIFTVVFMTTQLYKKRIIDRNVNPIWSAENGKWNLSIKRLDKGRPLALPIEFHPINLANGLHIIQIRFKAPAFFEIFKVFHKSLRSSRASEEDQNGLCSDFFVLDWLIHFL